ncbi:MAG: hypothetical protein D6815_13035, partial [Candidatus Dadabacteria bacterium]
MELRNVVVVDGVRSAFARAARGKLVATRLDDAAAIVLRALLDRNPKVSDRMIEDVGLGNVAGRGEFSYIGTVERLAGLPLEVCSFASNRQCGSSMETLHRIALSIMAGQIDCGIALGIERMARTITGDFGTNRITCPNPRIAELNDVQKAMAPDHSEYFSVPFPDYILETPWIQPMPQTAQNVAEVYDLKREDLDAYAVESHRKTHEAYERGIYADEIVPLEVEEPVFDDQGNWLENEHGPKV